MRDERNSIPSTIGKDTSIRKNSSGKTVRIQRIVALSLWTGIQEGGRTSIHRHISVQI